MKVLLGNRILRAGKQPLALHLTPKDIQNIIDMHNRGEDMSHVGNHMIAEFDPENDEWKLVGDRKLKIVEMFSEAEQDAKYELYYIRKHSHANGDCVIWWRPDSKGYTMNLDEAGKYTKEEAEAICRPSNSSCAYLVSRVDDFKGEMRVAHLDHLPIHQADIPSGY